MLLELHDVSKQYEGVTSAAGAGVAVLRDISLDLAAGEAIAVVGPSGSGKSTLLNLMGTLDRPSAGTVRLEGRDLAQLSDAELAVVRNQRLGFVFQAHHLLPQLSVLENVLVPTLVDPRPQRRDAPARARRLLERVGLAARLDHRPGQLSGGERQRVAVVRALINSPALLLADEPTGALDRAAAEALAQLLLELNREEHVALVVATHAASLAARMGRTYALCDGRLVEAGGLA